MENVYEAFQLIWKQFLAYTRFFFSSLKSANDCQIDIKIYICLNFCKQIIIKGPFVKIYLQFVSCNTLKTTFKQCSSLKPTKCRGWFSFGKPKLDYIHIKVLYV